MQNIGGVSLEQLADEASLAIDQVYHDLESLCICFPARISGSEILEKSLDFIHEYASMFVPSEHCHIERVDAVPHWVRGNWREDSLTVSIQPNTMAFPQPFPLERELHVLANGTSVGTGEEGVTGELIFVSSWEELDALGQQGKLAGKIVLYDYRHFSSYDQVCSYRFFGANRAASYGARAAIMRSLTPDSSVSGVHTGTQQKHDPLTMPYAPIPGACISVEDTESLRRLADRGHQLTLTLTLGCQNLPSVTSRNLIFEIPGSEHPDEIILIGGHADCWDCTRSGCQGAHDDGQAVMVCLAILRILYGKNWRPKRTIRVVIFTDEEVSSSGGIAYQKAHAHESANILVAVETDLGVGKVAGFGCTAAASTKAFLRKELLPVLRMILCDSNIDIKDEWTGRGIDIGPMLDHDHVPGLLLRHEDAWWDQDYFHYHHTNSDSIDKIDKTLLKNNLLTLLTTVWVLANSDERIPRNDH